MKVINDCALKESLLAEDKNVIDIVVPYLAAYHAILKKMNIVETKMNEKKKEQEKLEREAKKVTFM